MVFSDRCFLEKVGGGGYFWALNDVEGEGERRDMGGCRRGDIEGGISGFHGGRWGGSGFCCSGEGRGLWW